MFPTINIYPFIYTMNRKSLNYEEKWALVTGASSRDRQTFGYELAARRANVILSSRSEAVLDEMARDIRGRFEVEFEVISLDLADLDAPERLFCKIDEMNRTVQILINNAGFRSYGRLQENPVDRHGSQILLNAFSPAILA